MRLLLSTRSPSNMLEVRFLAGESESMCAEKCKKQNKKTPETPSESSCAKESARGECGCSGLQSQRSGGGTGMNRSSKPVSPTEWVQVWIVLQWDSPHKRKIRKKFQEIYVIYFLIFWHKEQRAEPASLHRVVRELTNKIIICWELAEYRNAGASLGLKLSTRKINKVKNKLKQLSADWTE